MDFRIVLTIIVVVQSPTLSQPCDSTYEKWQPSWIPKPRNDLLCQFECTRSTPTIIAKKGSDNCCPCHSCAIWEGTEKQLFIEYVSVLGTSLVLSKQIEKTPDHGVYEIKHRHSKMTELPSNICNWNTNITIKGRFSEEFESLKAIWGSIVKIDFSYNKIERLIDFSCLKRLDELKISNNKLTYVSNSSFTTLSNLRLVDFSFNKIHRLDPGVLTARNLYLFRADFSHNNIKALDVSNTLTLYPFCYISFRLNNMTKLVNELNFALNMTKVYGPGRMDFAENRFTAFPDFKTLYHLDEYAQLGHFLRVNYDIHKIPITCDCKVEKYMTLAYDLRNSLWPGFMALPCAGPDDLRGKIIVDVNPERFICNISADYGCQTPQCNCTDKPHSNTLFVNCTYDKGRKFGSIPTLPKSNYSDYISLDLSGHNIRSISDLKHLSNITMLNVSNNNILEIDNDTAKALENATLDISNNPNLRYLPNVFLAYRNVCSTIMTGLTISCDCDSRWIEEWLHAKKCLNEQYLFDCVLPNGEIKPALLFRANDIDCFYDHFSFMDTLNRIVVGTTFSLIVFGIFAYIFRYELLIICVRLKQSKRAEILPRYKYDVFISLDTTNESVTNWVFNKLKNSLIGAGYKIFIPEQDVTFGTERNSEVIKAINESCNFLIVLSEFYVHEQDDGMRPWTENEWKFCWHNYKRDRNKNIIVVNFDHLSSFDVDHLQIKAFLRVGCTVDFKNQNRDIMENICKILGKPFDLNLIYNQCSDNRNRRYRHIELPVSSTDTCSEAQKETQVRDSTTPEHITENVHFNESVTEELKKTPHIPLFKRNKYDENDNSQESDVYIVSREGSRVFQDSLIFVLADKDDKSNSRQFSKVFPSLDDDINDSFLSSRNDFISDTSSFGSSSSMMTAKTDISTTTLTSDNMTEISSV